MRRWKSRPVLERRGTLQCGRTWCAPPVSFFHPDIPPSFLSVCPCSLLRVSPATLDCESASRTGCFRCNWISSFALTLISKIFLATPPLASRLSGNIFNFIPLTSINVLPFFFFFFDVELLIPGLVANVSWKFYGSTRTKDLTFKRVILCTCLFLGLISLEEL